MSVYQSSQLVHSGNCRQLICDLNIVDILIVHIKLLPVQGKGWLETQWCPLYTWTKGSANPDCKAANIIRKCMGRASVETDVL